MQNEPSLPSGSPQDTTQTETTAPKPKRFPVIELFGPVIQGEGSQAGQQTMFIRFGGCDYRCQKCDSMHAVDPAAISKHARYLTADEIFDQLYKAYMETGVKWVTFSGGNPAMHKLDDLVEMLLYQGFLINVETQGTLWQDWMARVTCLTVCPKDHALGEKFEEAKFRKVLEKRGIKPTCIKVVVGSAIDLEFAVGLERTVREVYDVHSEDLLPWIAFYLSLLNPYPPVLNDELDLVDNPVLEFEAHGALAEKLLHDYKNLSEELLQDPRLKNWRFLPQLHVLVYGNESER